MTRYPPGVSTWGWAMARRGLLVLGAAALAVLASAPPAPAQAFVNWSAYLHGARHASYEPAALAVTTSNVGTLTRRWSWQPDPKTGTSPYLNASPTTYKGVIYIGAFTGDFYALSEATGRVMWKKTLPYLATPCGNKGIDSTATVASNPVTGALTVYVAAADHYLYALDPATGATRWRSLVGGTTSDYYNWSSPTVSGGRIYLGIGASCDAGTVGGLASYSQPTGAPIATYRTAPGATAGVPTIYTSALADGAGSVYATTGDGTTGDAFAIVRVRDTDLARLEAWKIPQPSTDGDFNASPAFFDATLNGVTTTMVGACNKNGIYYAWRAGNLSAGPVWTRRLGIPNDAFLNKLRICGGSSAYDWKTKRLLVGANQTTTTTTKLGSAYSLDPSTGAVRWFRALAAGPVIGSVSVNGAGVLAVPTYNASSTTNAVYLLNESTGAVLRTISTGDPDFAQPVFSDTYLLVTGQRKLSAYAP